ncbi:MAG: acrylyl-CoA reductase family protein [Acidimicrobiales bacterium]|nr:acryloyl-CoA reductase [Actinomycetota bacterium]
MQPADPFDAYVVERDGDEIAHGLRKLRLADLPEGDVLVRVEWSGVNHKDAMVTEPGNRVARVSPLVPGVDLAGVVEESTVAGIDPGTEVIAGGFDIGVSRHGGFAAYARLPADWVMPVPHHLTGRRAMIAGTAGLTAMMSVEALEAHGLEPGHGPVLVTAASGGVGSFAVAALSSLGYEVVASTGKATERDWLMALGASEVIGREDLDTAPGRFLAPERFAGAIDPAGGRTLSLVLRSLRYGAAVAASGIVAGDSLEGTLYPFIIRGVSLIGIDSVLAPSKRREQAWARLATAIDAATFESLIAREVTLPELPDAIADVLAGRVRGRVLVRVAPSAHGASGTEH